MKRILISTLLVMMVWSVSGQSISDLEILRTAFNKEKKVLIAEFLQLPDDQASLFWPIYNEYETKRGELGARRLALLNRYAAQYATMTEEQADILLKDVLDLQAKSLALKKKYVQKVKKELTPKTAMGFMQMEEFFDLEVRSQIYENIPFIKEN